MKGCETLYSPLYEDCQHHIVHVWLTMHVCRTSHTWREGHLHRVDGQIQEQVLLYELSAEAVDAERA